MIELVGGEIHAAIMLRVKRGEFFPCFDIVRMNGEMFDQARSAGGGRLGFGARIGDFALQADVFIAAFEMDRGAIALFDEHLVGGEMRDALRGEMGMFGIGETADDFVEGDPR